MKRALRKPLASLVAFSLVLGLVPLHAMADETPTLPEEPVALEEVLTEEAAPAEVVAPVEKEAPKEEVAPEEAPAEKTAPAEEADTEEAAPAEEEATPAEEAAPEDEPAAADHAAPAEAPAPVAKAETTKAAAPSLKPAADTVTATFDTLGGTPVPAAQEVASGTVPAWPAETVTKDGMELDGWSVIPPAQIKTMAQYLQNVENAGTLRAISKDTTFYATYKSRYAFESYDITRNKGFEGGRFRLTEAVFGTSTSNFIQSDVAAGTTMTLTALPDDGYRFVGWSSSNSKDGIFSTDTTYEAIVGTPRDIFALFEKATTVDMRVWTPGHGTVKINGSDYSTEFQGTWFEGTEVSIEAVPADGYKFNRWWIKASNQDNNRRVTTPGTTLVAGNDVEAVAYFGLETAEITITAPSAGSKASTAPDVMVPSGAGYSIQGDSMWGPGLSWVQSAEIGAAALDPATTFEAGQTYYAKVRLRDGADSFAATAGGSSFNTNLSVTGGVKQWQSNGAYTEEVGDGEYGVYIGIEAVIAVTIPEAETHTVTFDTQGGTPVSSQTVNDGEYAAKPDNPKKDGFFFLGWYEKPGAQLTREEVYANKPVGFDFAKTAITEDKTLYAVWYEGFYGATYDLSAKTPKYAETGGNVTFTSTYQQKPEATKVWWDYSIVEGSEVTVTAIPAAGARFVGWAPGTLNSSGNMPDDPDSLGDIVSTANPYTFTFNGKTALAALFEPEAPKYELSFAFTNLYPGAQPQALLESLTVNGEDWTPTSGNITAKDIPAGSSVTATVKVTDNASLATYNNPENTISDLVPTYSDDGSKLTFTFTMPETDARIVVYLFEAVTVTYDANGGVKQPAWADSVKWMKYTASTPATINVSQELYDLYSGDLRVQPPAGSTFAGIEVTQNKTGAKVTGKPGEVITGLDFSEGGAIKFLWVKDVTVTFDAKGGTPVPVAQKFKSGEKATEPTAPTKDGWTFGGWYTDEGLTSEFDFSKPVNDDTTLYARWNGQIDISSYDRTTAKHDSGGTFDYETTEWTGEDLYSYGTGKIAEGTTVSLTATPAEGNRFVGWAKDSVAGVIVSEDETYEFTFTETPTRLYAVFEEIPPTLTLHWTSVDGDDLVDPIAIESTPGTDVAYALNLYKGSSMATDIFANAKEGYVWSGHQMRKPISAYKSMADLNAARVKGTDDIGKGMDIYYVMLKQIDAVEMSVEAPKCGTKVSMSGEKQLGAPNVTLASGGNYGSAFEGQTLAVWGEWVENHMEFVEGTLKGGESYPMLARLAADFGYCFAGGVKATVTGATDVQTMLPPDTSKPALTLGVSAQVAAEHVPGEAVTENEVKPTCTEDGSHDEVVYCTACNAEISRKTVTDPALGHDWGEWTVVKEATEEADGLEQRTCKRCELVEERVIPKLVVEYTCAAGDGQTWTKGSDATLEFTFKRSIADETCFSHFTGVRVDGKLLSAKAYTAKAGSTVVTLSADYLETLAVGEHTLTAQFDDGNGEASATFAVAEKDAPAPTPEPAKKDEAKPASKLPQTGDPFALVSLVSLTLALVGLAVTLTARRIRE